ncbi:hypothetical protein [Bacillus thuringiensis]|nr:hypothetical protein [Bacillus thuringiensis]
MSHYTNIKDSTLYGSSSQFGARIENILNSQANISWTGSNENE